MNKRFAAKTILVLFAIVMIGTLISIILTAGLIETLGMLGVLLVIFCGPCLK